VSLQGTQDSTTIRALLDRVAVWGLHRTEGSTVLLGFNALARLWGSPLARDEVPDCLRCMMPAIHSVSWLGTSTTAGMPFDRRYAMMHVCCTGQRQY